MCNPPSCMEFTGVQDNDVMVVGGKCSNLVIKWVQAVYHYY